MMGCAANNGACEWKVVDILVLLTLLIKQDHCGLGALHAPFKIYSKDLILLMCFN